MEKKFVDCESPWAAFLFFHSDGHKSAYLKALTILWEIEVKAIAEIGVFQGKNSKLLRALFPKAQLYLIDPWVLYEEYRLRDAGPISKRPYDYKRAYNRVKRYFAKDPQTTIVRLSSLEAAECIPNDLDLVFIDGNHAYPYVKQDIEAWLPKIRKGGILAGHDYDPQRFPGVVQAVDEHFKESVLIGNDSTWVVRVCR